MTQQEIITQFYLAFQQQDAEKMISFYHDDIEFTDPAFGTIRGNDAKNMWRMLCENAQNFSLNYSHITNTSAHWEAKYNFSGTGKRVHNKIDASFVFKDGKIYKHTDVFNLHKWATQAFGIKGFLIGNTSFFKKKLQKQTHKLLAKYTKKNA